MIKTIEEIDAAIHAAENWVVGTAPRAWAIRKGHEIITGENVLERVRQDSSVLP